MRVKSVTTGIAMLFWQDVALEETYSTIYSHSLSKIRRHGNVLKKLGKFEYVQILLEKVRYLLNFEI